MTATDVKSLKYTGPFPWSDEHINYLIDCVKQSEHLWNKAHRDNYNTAKKQIFWLKFVTDFNRKFNVSITNTDAVKKWLNLKTYFMTEAQKIVLSIRKNPLSSWKFYDKMSFLDELYKKADSTANNPSQSKIRALGNEELLPISNNDNSQNEDANLFCSLYMDANDSVSPDIYHESNVDDTQEMAIGSPKLEPMSFQFPSDQSDNSLCHEQQNNITTVRSLKRKRTRIMTSSNDQYLMESCLNTTKRLTKYLKRKPKNKAFGEYIVAELEGLDGDLQNEVKTQINNILFKFNEEQFQRTKNKNQK